MAGRRPLPTQLKVIRGTGRPSRINREEPKASGRPSPPGYLDHWAKVEWARIWKIWGWVLGESDRAIAAEYCQAYSDRLRLTREIRAEGELVKTDRGGMKRNPKTLLLREAQDRLHKAAVELGLTPAARARVKVRKPEEKSGWEKL